MAADLAFTGERFLPGTLGEIAYEHWHRYAFARAYVNGKRVADVACGEGYGSALLARAGATVVGVDIAPDTIAHARSRYDGLANARFEEGSATALPFPDASLDAVISFETIEHLPREDQSRMLAEFDRVLTPDGILVLSTPNPIEYSIARQYCNPFHCHEPERSELAELLGRAFPAQRWFRQRRYFGSAVWSETREARFEAWVGDSGPIDVAEPPAAMYFIVIAARSAATLPSADVGLSLFADRSDTELARLDGQAREVIRLDGLLGEMNATIEKLTARVQHLEETVVDRDAKLTEIRVERDALLSQLKAVMVERNAVSAALDTAREELAGHVAWQKKLEQQIAYRQSVRWWLRLPWFRVKLLWQAIRSH
jgi:ubiquinone/menaquinone biosynthesis C-methylase UbiE